MQRHPLELTLELSRAEDAEDPFSFRYEPQEYRRHDGGKVWSARFPWNAQLLADLGALGAPRPDPAGVQRLGDSLRTFLGGLGWESEEARLREALDEGRPVHLTCRFAAAELYSLPWELVTLEPERRHLGELPGCLIRYEWPKTQSARARPSPPRGRLLLAWSTAGGEAGVSAHLRALREACERYEYPFNPERDVVAHVSLEKLSRTLATSGPVAALHLLCHGSRGDTTYGLLWGDADERQFVDAAALRRVLAPHADKIRMVVLSACHGGDSGELGNHLGSVAQALHAVGIPAVVASRLPLSVKGSVELTGTLYRELLKCEPLDAALGAARMRLALSPPGLDWASLQLYARAEEAESLRPIIFQPYRGLLTFEARHRRFFHGRKAQQRALVRRVREALQGKRPRFQVVAGASGSGKSSLVRAGLVALLKPPAWEVHVTRPGELSSEAVARLRRPREKQRLLLMVDQFEEVFTLMTEARERQAFVQALWDLARSPESNAVVLVTLRFDYFERCRELVLDGGQARLDGVVVDAAHCLSVPPLQGRQLEAAIEGPARRVGLRFEGALSEVLRKDVEREPGGLPLLEYALDQLWEKRDGDTLTERTYKELGGVTGALTRTASEMYARLSPFEQRQARRLLLALINFRDDASSLDTRRRARREQLRVADGEAQKALDAVIEKFVGKRLLVVGGGPEAEGGSSEAWIELAHEELLRSWLLLSTWVKENQERGRALQILEEWAEEWRGHRKGKDGGASYLLSGERLTFARDVQTRYPGELSPELERFIQASWERSEAERLRELKRQRNLRRLSVALTIGFALAVCFGGLAFLQTEEAKKARDIALARELMARARLQMQEDPPLGMALMAHAHEKLVDKRGPADLASEIEVLSDWSSRRLLVVLRAHSAGLLGAAFNHDGRRVVTASEDYGARVWDVATGKPLGYRLGHSGRVTMAAFSPDGRWVVTASEDKTARVWDAETGQPVSEPLQHPGEVLMATFSPDGRRVITIGGRRNLWEWDTKTWKKISDKPLPQTVEGRGVPSPDGRLLLSSSDDQTFQVWTMATGEPVGVSFQNSKEYIGVALSTDNRWVFTVNADKTTAQVVELETGKPLGEPFRHTGEVTAAVFSPDNRRVFTVRADRTAQVWEVATGEKLFDKPLHHSGRVRTAAFSPDGRRVVTASEDRTARVWDVGTGEPLGGPLENLGKVYPTGFSPDGRRMVTLGEDQTVRVWDVATGKPFGEPLRFSGKVYPVPFSSDGQRVVILGKGQTVRVWDVATGKPLGEPLQLSGVISPVGFSPDGRRVVTLDKYKKTARVWDVATGKPLGEPLQLSGVISPVGFSPDGRRMATLGEDLTVRVWDVATGKPLGEPLQSSAKVYVYPVAFSSDGQRVVILGEDQTVRVWDVATGKPLGEPVAPAGRARRTVITPDGRHVMTVGDDLIVRVWDCELCSPAMDVFNRNRRDLTCQERNTYLHEGKDCSPAMDVVEREFRKRTCQERNMFLHENKDCSLQDFRP